MRVTNLAIPTLSVVLGLVPCRARGDGSVDIKRAASSEGRITVSNTSGSIILAGGEKTEVAITGSLGDGVDRLDVSGGPDLIQVRVVLKSGSGDGHANLTIHLPQGSQIDVDTVSADTNGRDLRGSLKITSVSGDVTVGGHPKTCEVKTVSGDVRITGVVSRTEVKTVSGDVHVDEGSGELEISTVSGDLAVSGEAFARSRLKSVSGDLHVTGNLAPGGSFEFESHSGDATLELPGSAAATFEVSTFSGEITNDFGAHDAYTYAWSPSSSDSPHSRSVPGRSARFSIGDGRGGATARIKTFSGDIRITKH